MMTQQHGIVTLQDLLNRQEWDQALAALDQQIQREPQQRQWSLVRASVLIKSGRTEEGTEALESLTSQFPDFLEAWINLGQTCKALANYSAAYAAYQQALQLAPEHPLARKGAAECAQALGDHHAALSHWQGLARAGSDDQEVWLQLAICQLESEPAAAIEAAKKARVLNPERADICHVLARAYVNNEHFEQAQPLFEQLIAQPEWQAEALKGKIACRLYLADCDGALSLLDAFRQAGGSEVDACLMEAKAQVQLGDRQAALAAYRKSLAEDGACVDAWYGLLMTDAGAAETAEVASLENLWQSLASLRDRMLAGFALARWYEARGNLEQQLHWLDRANEARRFLRPFDKNMLTGRQQITRRFCTADWCSRLALPESDSSTGSVTPILICGMPRSGTTLVEQTLATYRQVTACGENQAHAQAIDLVAETMGSRQLDVFLKSLDQDGASVFREHYQQILIENEGVNTPWLTSKSMDLAFNLGLLLAACPEARAIHVCRHPLDVGLGCYKQYFAQGQAFSGSWEGIANYFATFETLMVHWAGIFPDRILAVRYEDLVREPEAVTRRIAAHCGLEWQADMLDFQQNKGVVTTASAIQVREGLFSSAAGRWERYGKLLEPLMAALEREGVDWQAYDNNKER